MKENDWQKPVVFLLPKMERRTKMSHESKQTYLEEVERNLEEIYSNFKYLYHIHMTDERALTQLGKRTLYQIWNYRETDFNSSFYVPYKLKKRYSDKVKNYLF